MICSKFSDIYGYLQVQRTLGWDVESAKIASLGELKTFSQSTLAKKLKKLEVSLKQLSRYWHSEALLQTINFWCLSNEKMVREEACVGLNAL